MTTKKERLQEIRRRLGPYMSVRDEPFAMCDAEIARRIVELTRIVEELCEDEKPAEPQKPVFDPILDALGTGRHLRGSP